jgi:hypothetical protein
MPEETTRNRELSEGGELAAQWIGLLLAPATFFAHLQIAYVLVPWACLHDGDVWLHVVGVVSVVLALIGALVAWRLWDRTGRDAPGEGGGALPRARFLALVGVCVSALFVLLLAVQWIAAFFISPCQ